MDLIDVDGIAQADLVRAGELTATELVEAALQRIEATDPGLGFLVERMDDQARALAARAPGVGQLAGVPMLLKDHLATCARVRHTSGSRYLRDYTPATDSELVARYKRGGLVPVGTAAACELALLSTAESARYGPCRNPWDTDRTTGGSSGGSAAAVAARSGAGGPRQRRRRLDPHPRVVLRPLRAQAHARTQSRSGPEHGDIVGGLLGGARPRRGRSATARRRWTSPPVRCRAIPTQRGRRTVTSSRRWAPTPGRLRIALSADAPTGIPVDADCRAAVESAGQLCEELGHAVEEASPPIDGVRLEEAFNVI